jgi:hypothetical protein
MKKVVTLLAIIAGSVFAETRGHTETLTATGTTAALAVDAMNHTVQVVTSGSPSACTVRLEGSLNLTNWFDLSGSTSCNGTDAGTGTAGVMFHVAQKSVTYTRVRLITWTGGTNAVITYRGQN